jgi:drug/metabolite transporter (DMT)-like permease
MPAQIRNWIYLVALSVIWGASFMGVKLALTGFGPVSVAALRIALAAIALNALAFVLGKGLPSLREARIWAHIAGMGLFSNVIPFLLLSWGQLHVASGFAGISMAVVPLLVLPLAHALVPGERLNLRKVTGFALGFAGVILLIGPGAVASTGTEAENLARLACVFAAGCYAVGSIVTRLCPPVDQISFSAGALLVASLFILPAALAAEDMSLAPGAPALLAVLYLGIFPTALATILLVSVINSAGPGFLSIVNYLVPVWSILFGVTFLGESLPAVFFLALAFILSGLAVARARAPRRRP